jgi:hypothetical protein
MSLEDAGRQVEGYVEQHNNVRLNSAIGDITPNEHARRASAGDPRRQGSEAGDGETTSRPRERARTLVSGRFRHKRIIYDKSKPAAMRSRSQDGDSN